MSRDPRLTFAHAAHLAHAARAEFTRLPADEKATLTRELATSLWPVSRWAATLRARAPQFLCLGERHRDVVRRFLASRLLPQLEVDVLVLEADTRWVRLALQARARGAPVPPLLEATMAPVLDALATHHPAARIIGVDESELERRARRNLARAELSQRAREDSIVTNLRRRWDPGRRHVVLFGALHCRDLPRWLFARLPRESDLVKRDQSINAVVLARYQEPAIELLMYLLEEMGFQDQAWVVPDTRRFPHLLLQWLPNVTDAFATYDSAIIFDDRRIGTDPSR